MGIMSELDLQKQEADHFSSVQKHVLASTPIAEKTAEEIDAEKRLAHEAAEAKRKAEWEAKKKEKDEKVFLTWQSAINVPKDKLSDKSVKRISDMTEKLTHRNMKLCVTEYLQTLCYENIQFAQHALHPKKSMINCFKYINGKALEYLKQDQIDNGEPEIDRNVIGGDVPDALCYQWAEEYFMNLELEIDQTDGDKPFVEKPYRSTLPAKSKNNKSKNKSSEKQDSTEQTTSVQLQLSFDDTQSTFSEGVTV